MVLPDWLKELIKKAARFSLVGAISTACSLGGQVILLKYFHTPLIPTYIALYGATILLSYFLNSRYTFKSEITLRRMTLYYSIYLASLGLGVLLLALFQAILPSLDEWILPLVVLPFTLAWNFVLSARFLKPKAETSRVT